MSDKGAESNEQQLREAEWDGGLLWKEIQDIEHINIYFLALHQFGVAVRFVGGLGAPDGHRKPFLLTREND